jgi:hypothetical protein
VRLYRRFAELCADFFDEVDLVEAAAATLVENQGTRAETGDLVLYLARDVSPATEALLRAAVSGEAVHAIFGLTGDAEVDAVVEAAANRLAAPGEVIRPATTGMPPVQRIVSATEPEEEVREAIRQAMALAAEGIPLHRIAMVYGSSDVYAGLLDDALTSAEIPHSGESNRTLAQSIAGRTVLGLPRIAASSGAADPGFARDVLMDWLTGAPIRHEGNEAPSHLLG